MGTSGTVGLALWLGPDVGEPPGDEDDGSDGIAPGVSV